MGGNLLFVLSVILRRMVYLINKLFFHHNITYKYNGIHVCVYLYKVP